MTPEGAEHHFLLDAAEGAGVEYAVRGLVGRLRDRLAAAGAAPADVVKLALYVAEPLPPGLLAPELDAAFGAAHPAVEVFVQPPCEGPAALLAWAVSGAGVERPAPGVARLRLGPASVAVLGQVSDEGSTRRPDYTACFDRFAARLAAAGFDYADVAKTWTCFPATDAETAAASFLAFNEARREFFASVEFDRYAAEGVRYPGNTGVGVHDVDALLSGIAARGTRLVPIENPAQASAFEYPKERLATPALFSRAMAVEVGEEALVLVSGTGSVVGAETAHVGDPERQTEQVLENIATLTASENLRRSGLSAAAGGLDMLAHFVMFVADGVPLEPVRRALARVLPGEIPVLTVRAPLSRAELLVEGEGLAIVPLEPA